MICEKCWADAFLEAQVSGESHYREYKKLLEKRKDNPCTKREQDLSRMKRHKSVEGRR